jgi:hypothetical protein
VIYQGQENQTEWWQSVFRSDEDCGMNVGNVNGGEESIEKIIQVTLTLQALVPDWIRHFQVWSSFRSIEKVFVQSQSEMNSTSLSLVLQF